jgi:hypothetical protein
MKPDMNFNEAYNLPKADDMALENEDDDEYEAKRRC